MSGLPTTRHEMKRASYKLIRTSPCRDCRTPIELWQTTHGKFIALTALKPGENDYNIASPHRADGTSLVIHYTGTLATGAKLRYAFSRPTQSGQPGIAGPTGIYAGNRGNLRDSDDAPSLYGNALYNWCVIFSKPINN